MVNLAEVDRSFNRASEFLINSSMETCGKWGWIINQFLARLRTTPVVCFMRQRTVQSQGRRRTRPQRPRGKEDGGEGLFLLQLRRPSEMAFVMRPTARTTPLSKKRRRGPRVPLSSVVNSAERNLICGQCNTSRCWMLCDLHLYRLAAVYINPTWRTIRNGEREKDGGEGACQNAKLHRRGLSLHPPR